MLWGGNDHDLGATRATAPVRRPALRRVLGLTLTTALALALGSAPLAGASADPVAAPVAGTDAARTSFLAGADKPTAVAVASDGTTFVGFRNGGTLARLSSQGDALTPLVLDQPDPVTDLEVSGKSLWIYYGRSVTQMTFDGVVKKRWLLRPEVWCPASVRDPGLYGGIAVQGRTVYVAQRCGTKLQAYTTGGILLASTDLPGKKPGGGLAYVPGSKGVPARVVVALPGQGTLAAYDAATLSDGDKPRTQVRLPKVADGFSPMPTDLSADKLGQLAVLDAANNAVFMMDGGNDYTSYRTLGHPAQASAKMGWLNLPTAIAQHPQDGTKRAGNLYVADTRNGRVQRWSNGGYSFWASTVEPGSDNPAADEPWACGTDDLLINRGAKYTVTRRVMLQVATPEGADTIEIANNKAFEDSWTTDVKDSCIYDWYTSFSGRVFVRFPGSGTDAVWRDAIVVDTVAPRITSAKARWVRAEKTWRLDVAGSDKKSGLGTIEVSRTRSKVAVSQKWQNVLKNADGRVFTWVRAVDKAGNTGPWRAVKQPDYS
ncbi:hypothetical protein [Nocardioides bruguierae]|uniref:hypothetical protein n=1 Tax=Nocardioides bruguierae TaxID=2945102 RepID=UPI0020210032|nr:hypothetical protein [Nocardioides bruguierae]MCL8027619.1 hypothetical protein [Nocardioides bruguierae]